MTEDRHQGSVINISGLGLTYDAADGEVHALDNIDLKIEGGEFVSFIGPSGCGKTTLLRCIADLEKPTKGSLTVFDKSADQARIERRYGFVFQAPALYPWRTVKRNVELPHEIFGTKDDEKEKAVKNSLELVELDGFAKKFPWQLSGGMQQRVSIARALSFNPRLLLMDEPFGALDEITRNRLNLQLLQIWQRINQTIVFVTHSISEAIFLSTRIVVMSPRPGRIVDIVDIDLPKERNMNTYDNPKFTELASKLRQLLADS